MKSEGWSIWETTVQSAGAGKPSVIDNDQCNMENLRSHDVDIIYFPCLPTCFHCSFSVPLDHAVAGESRLCSTGSREQLFGCQAQARPSAARVQRNIPTVMFVLERLRKRSTINPFSTSLVWQSGYQHLRAVHLVSEDIKPIMKRHDMR